MCTLCRMQVNPQYPQFYERGMRDYRKGVASWVGHSIYRHDLAEAWRKGWLYQKRLDNQRGRLR